MKLVIRRQNRRSFITTPSLVLATIITQLLLMFSHLFSSSLSLTCAPTSSLGRKSTASQVYQYLHQNNQLAPFAAASSSPGTVVLTGGNSGIGFQTVRTLVQDAGLQVILCARNVESAHAAVKAARLTPEEQKRCEVQYLDLSNLSTVQQAAESILSTMVADGSDKKIDCLINNAGIMALPTRETTVDGIEKQVGTNHVGHFLLTRLLVPHMAENGRIVTVASTAHKMAGQIKTNAGKYDWESSSSQENNSYSPWGAYGKSKLCNILFASQLQKELQKEPTTSNKNMDSVSLHPGVIASPLWKHSLPSFLQPMVRLISNKSIEQGAATTVYCALARHVVGGAYYEDCKVAVPSGLARDSQNQEALWDYTETRLAELGIQLPSLQPQQQQSESRNGPKLVGASSSR